ncbi:ankyrin repeat-containing domain protein [Hypoxylon sp. FL1150]|nr:ankyrin repeat-containing domain protein [Hypoxylon sp. FL1150]
MAKAVSLRTLVGGVEHACGAIANTLADLGKSIAYTKTTTLPVAAECLTTKVVLQRLGGILSPREIAESDVGQEEELEASFEVIVHSISEILVDVDHEITRLRRYFIWGDPLAASKLVPVLQDFFIDVRFNLRRNRSSLCLILDCLQSGNLLGTTIQLFDQTSTTKSPSKKSSTPSRLQPLVAIQLHKISDQPETRQLHIKYRPDRDDPNKTGSRFAHELHEAIAGCDRNAVHRCLAKKADPNAQLDPAGVLPIHLALSLVEASLASDNKTAAGASASIVTALVIAGANLRALDENERTPLIRAVMNEMSDSLISLMLEQKASVKAIDGQRNTALHYAATKPSSDEMGNKETVRVLLVHGANQALKNKKGRTPLHEAVSFECLGRVEELLEYGADLEIPDKNGWTPLFGAVTQGNVALTKLICDRGAIVDKKDKNGYTALHYAASHGSKDIAGILLDAGADVNLISMGETPLCRAASKSNLPLVMLLLSHGADIALPSPGCRGALPIHVAAMGNNVAILTVLLDAGSSINGLDDERRTPLRWAMDGGRNEFVHFLFSKGAGK